MSTRSLLVRALPCLACVIEGVIQPLPTEEHHQNLGGKAGQKRLGDECSIPLCTWHHRGNCKDEIPASRMRFLYGPSLARQSKKFREAYGSDDVLLAKTNTLLGNA